MGEMTLKEKKVYMRQSQLYGINLMKYYEYTEYQKMQRHNNIDKIFEDEEPVVSDHGHGNLSSTPTVENLNDPNKG